MYLFCPVCGNLLVVEEGPRSYRFACNTCPYVQNIAQKASQFLSHFLRGTAFILLTPWFVSKVSSYKYPKLKEVDDVLGGAAAWENVDHTNGG